MRFCLIFSILNSHIIVSLFQDVKEMNQWISAIRRILPSDGGAIREKCKKYHRGIFNGQFWNCCKRRSRKGKIRLYEVLWYTKRRVILSTEPPLSLREFILIFRATVAPKTRKFSLTVTKIWTSLKSIRIDNITQNWEHSEKVFLRVKPCKREGKVRNEIV